MTQLLIVRHGETVQNNLHICQGQSEGELSELGVEQCQKASKEITNYDIVISSTLQRARSSAEIITAGEVEIVLDDRVIERGFGTLEGKIFPSVFDMFAEFPEMGAESMNSIKSRLTDFIEDIKRDYPNKVVLLVTHGMVTRVLLSMLKGIELNDVKLAKNCQVQEVAI